MTRKTWYGDALEAHAPKIGSLAGGAVGGALGTLAMPGQGTAVGAALGGSLGGAAATHGIRWLRQKWGFDSGGQIRTAPGADAFAIVHNGELILRRKEAEAVKQLLVDSGFHLPAVRQLPSIADAVLDGAKLEMRLRA